MEKMKNVIKKRNIKVHLIWFDSLGAKSSSIFVETPDIKLLVDPGAAAMQPTYPLSSEEKERLKFKALQKISQYSEKARIIFISHYHNDHYTLASKIPEGFNYFYKNKIIWLKNPNKFINHTQWKRAREFCEEIYNNLQGEGNLYIRPHKVKVPLLEKELPFATSKDYGDYQERKKELLEKGRKRLSKLKELWENKRWVREFRFKKGRTIFVDGKQFSIGKTKIRFTFPHYHGIEYDRVGWVIGLIVEYDGKKLIYSSDIEGPQIEDYAEEIIRENPDILILDGFPTYLFGKMINRINMERAKNNIIRIVYGVKAHCVIIYDHHILREEKYKERFKEVYKKTGKKLMTAAEYMSEQSMIDKITKENVIKYSI